MGFKTDVTVTTVPQRSEPVRLASWHLINGHQAMSEPQNDMPASAAPAPGSDALLDRALACPVRSESVRRTPVLFYAQCTCGHFHRDQRMSAPQPRRGRKKIEHNLQRNQ